MVDVNLKVSAIEKLLDYAASGIGAVAGPMLLPWRAQWEGKAKRISARADADVRSIQAASEAEALPIIAAAQAEARQYLMASDAQVHGELEITRDNVTQRIAFQEKKRLANIRDVVSDAAAVLGDKEVDDHEPDPDWTARYFDYVQDVTSDDLKKLWARILAGEVESPGRTSLRTLSILRDMSQRDARMFHAMMEYVISDFILVDHCAQAFGSRKDTELLGITNLGLAVSGILVGKSVTLRGDGTHPIVHHGDMLMIEGPANAELELNLSIAVLTSQGLELAGFCVHKPNLRYLGLFAGWLNRHNCKLTLAPILSTEGNGTLHYSRSAVRVIQPVNAP